MYRLIKCWGYSWLAGSVLLGNAELEPMVVSVLRLETEDKNLAARVQSIDQFDIEQSGALDLVELLRREANLQVRSTSANSTRSTVSMGGFGENGQLRTLVLLDGHRLNTIDQSVINWYTIPISLVESIEVIRGGQAGTYGNHAVGGVIKINSKIPQKEPTGSLETSAGTFNSLNVRGAYSQKLGEFGVTIFGDRVESEGYRVNGDHETEAGGVRLDWGNESEFRGYFSLNLSKTDFGLPGDLNASALSADRRQTTDPDDRGNEESDHVRAGLSFEINKDWRWENRFGYQDREVGVNMPSATWIADTKYESFSYNPILHYNQDQADWVVGMDYFKDEVSADTNFDDSVLERSSIAVFVSTRYALSDHWNWNGNLRIEKMGNSGRYGDTHLNEVKNDQWAGAIGLVREFKLEDRIYGTIRRYYRYPAMDEILLAWPPPSSLNGNLRPEDGFEVDLGVDWSIDRLFLSGRIFRQWMDDEIIYNSSTWSNVNLEKTRRMGLDLSMDWQMQESFLAGVRYEFVRATMEGVTFNGSKIPLVPEGLLRLFIEFNPHDTLLLRLGGSYVGESYRGSDFENTAAKLDDYWLYDIAVNYQWVENVTLFGGIENLLDESYLSTAFGPGLYPGEGRKVTAGLRYSF